jgi:hypothetical protein
LSGDRPRHHEEDLHPENDQGEGLVVELDANHHRDGEQGGQPDDAERHQPADRRLRRQARLTGLRVLIERNIVRIGPGVVVRVVVGRPLVGAGLGRWGRHAPIVPDNSGYGRSWP